MIPLTSDLSLTPAQAEQRRDRVARAVKWTLVAGVGLLLAPLAFSLLQATVALVLSATLALLAVTVAPVLAMKLANWQLSAILDEARRNPIPTLEWELIRRKTALKLAGDHLRASLAQVEGFITQAEDAARQYPDMAPRWRDRAAKARALADARKRSYAQAFKAVDAFGSVVERCRTEWKLVVAESAMNQSLHLSQGDAMAQLRSRTAIDAVTDRMNEAFAGLELALLQDNDAGAAFDAVAHASPQAATQHVVLAPPSPT